jgi:hypothetical protein
MAKYMPHRDGNFRMQDGGRWALQRIVELGAVLSLGCVSQGSVPRGGSIQKL